MADNETGVIRRFEFDEGSGTVAIDSSAAGVNGTLVNTPAYRSGELVNGSHALLLDGTNQYVNVGTITATDGATAFTVTGRCLLTLEDFDLILAKYASTSSRFEFGLGGSGFGANTGFIVSVATSEVSYAISGTGIVSSGKWFHWAIVFDGTQATDATRLKLYINGVQRTLTFTLSVPTTLPNSAADAWWIGWRDDSPAGSSMKGQVDAVKFALRAFSAADVALDASETRAPDDPFILDRFTDTTGTILDAHIGDFGAGWTEHASYATGSIIVSDANRIRSNATASSVFYASGHPASANYYVEAEITVFTLIASSYIGVAARIDTSADTRYQAVYNVANTAWELIRINAGTGATLGSYTETLTLGRTYMLRLEAYGAALRVLIDGAIRIVWKDTTITAAGKAGVVSAVNTSNSTGLHLDKFKCDDIEPRFLIVCDGDSIVHGATSSSTFTGWGAWPSRLQRALGDGYYVANYGVDSQQLDTCLANIDDIIDLDPDLVLCCAGGNDAAVALDSAATIEANTVAYGQALQAEDIPFIDMTILRRGSTQSVIDVIDEVNTYKLANYLTYASDVSNIAADAHLDSPTDAGYINASDLTHPLEAGYKVIDEDYVTPAVDRAILSQAATAAVNALIASALQVSDYEVDENHIWSYQSRSQTTAPMYVSEVVGFNAACRMDFSEPLPDGVCIATIGTVSIANITGKTKPVVGTPAKTKDYMAIDIPIDARVATPATYTVTGSVTDTTGGVYVRKGFFVLGAAT